MAWITITLDNVKSRLLDIELAAWTRRNPNQADPVPDIISGVTSEVRGRVRAYRFNTLDPNPATIPSELLNAAMSLVIAGLSTRLPIALSKERADARDAAHKLLEDVANGKFRLENVSLPDQERPGQPGGIELASWDETNHLTDKSLNGLL